MDILSDFFFEAETPHWSDTFVGVHWILGGRISPSPLNIKLICRPRVVAEAIKFFEGEFNQKIAASLRLSIKYEYVALEGLIVIYPTSLTYALIKHVIDWVEGEVWITSWRPLGAGMGKSPTLWWFGQANSSAPRCFPVAELEDYLDNPDTIWWSDSSQQARTLVQARDNPFPNIPQRFPPYPLVHLFPAGDGSINWGDLIAEASIRQAGLIRRELHNIETGRLPVSTDLFLATLLDRVATLRRANGWALRGRLTRGDERGRWYRTWKKICRVDTHYFLTGIINYAFIRSENIILARAILINLYSHEESSTREY